MSATLTNSSNREQDSGFSMKKAVKSTTRAILESVPLSVWSQLFPKDVIGLCYHIVADGTLPHARFYPFKNTEQFRSDVEYLAQGYGLLDYETLVARRLGSERPTRDNKFMITFDDGFAQCFDVVRPILEEFDAPAAFFITTDFCDNQGLFFESKLSLCIGAIETASEETLGDICSEMMFLSYLDRDLSANQQSIVDCRKRNVVTSVKGDFLRETLIETVCQLFEDDSEIVEELCRRLNVDCDEYLAEKKPFLTTEQIREMSSAGYTIGAHTRSHCNMNGMTDAAIEEEIVQSCSIIHEITGKEVPFAFPYNGRGIDRALLARIREEHDFIGLYFDTTEMVRDEPHIVNRIGADVPNQAITNGTNLPGVVRRTWSRRSSWN